MIILIRNFLGMAVLMGVLSIFATTAKAQNLPRRNVNEKVFDYARVAGTIAGYAVYCKADPIDIETYTIKVEAKITGQTNNDFDQISARLLFKNTRDARSGKEPKSGCADFFKSFTRIVGGSLEEPALKDIN